MIKILTSIYLILFWKLRNYTRLYLKFLKYMGAKTKIFNDDLFINSWVSFSKRSF